MVRSWLPERPGWLLGWPRLPPSSHPTNKRPPPSPFSHTYTPIETRASLLSIVKPPLRPPFPLSLLPVTSLPHCTTKAGFSVLNSAPRHFVDFFHSLRRKSAPRSQSLERHYHCVCRNFLCPWSETFSPRSQVGRFALSSVDTLSVTGLIPCYFQ